ncbi:MAG: hypothetical protein IPJ13_24545 [Saprospiraceae bacterium]|nr:hypothetical protein [Saprospiraceae bacterium]
MDMPNLMVPMYPVIYKTNSDNTNHNNWSTIGLSNPYTAEPGYKPQDYSRKLTITGEDRLSIPDQMVGNTI